MSEMAILADVQVVGQNCGGKESAPAQSPFVSRKACRHHQRPCCPKAVNMPSAVGKDRFGNLRVYLAS
jgi:hypothetical protein